MVTLQIKRPELIDFIVRISLQFRKKQEPIKNKHLLCSSPLRVLTTFSLFFNIRHAGKAGAFGLRLVNWKLSDKWLFLPLYGIPLTEKIDTLQPNCLA